MENLDTNKCFDYFTKHYSDCHDCSAIINDLCNCFDSNILTEFVNYLQEYEHD